MLLITAVKLTLHFRDCLLRVLETYNPKFHTGWAKGTYFFWLHRFFFLNVDVERLVNDLIMCRHNYSHARADAHWPANLIWEKEKRTWPKNYVNACYYCRHRAAVAKYLLPIMNKCNKRINFRCVGQIYRLHKLSSRFPVTIKINTRNTVWIYSRMKWES